MKPFRSKVLLTLSLILFSLAGCPGLFPQPDDGAGEGEILTEGEGETAMDREGEGQSPQEGDGEGQPQPDGEGEGDGESSGAEFRVVAEFTIDDPRGSSYDRGEGNAILLTEAGDFVIAGASLIATDVANTPEHALILEVTAAGTLNWWREVEEGYPRTTLYALARASGEGYTAAGTMTNRTEYYSNSISGSAYLVSVDDGGTVVWSQTYGNEDGMTNATFKAVLQMPDGGYLCAGHARTRDDLRSYVVRTDDSGAKLWSSAYENLRPRSATFVVATPDGGYLVGGNEGTNIGAVAYGIASSMFISKVGEDGLEAWTRSYLQNEVSGVANSIPTEGGGAVTLGTRSSADSSDSDIFLLKVDSDGAVVWTQTYDSGEGDDKAVRVRATPDGGFILAGNAPSGPYIVRVDEDGNKLRAHVHSIEHTESHYYELTTTIKDLRAVSEGVYVLVGYKQLPDISHGVPSNVYVLTLAEEDGLTRKTQGARVN